MPSFETWEGLQALLEAAPDAILIVDAAGKILLANNRAEAMFGHPRKDIVGAPIELFVPERYKADHVQHRQRYMGDPKTRPMGVGLDLHARRKDGTEFPVDISLSPMPTPEGQRVVAVVRDVTERKHVEAAKRLAGERELEIKRLRAMDAFKTAILNTASHHLNTPLTPIRLQLHVLTGASEGLTDKQRHALQTIDRNFERLARIVQDILDVARLQGGRLQLHKSPVRLDALAQRAAAALPAESHAAPIALEVEPVELVADGKRLQQVISMLLSNARAATLNGRIVLRVKGTKDWATVEVEDTGIGLTEAQLDRLFEPLSQAHDLADAPGAGMGLGLYLAKGLVEAHGGTIGARSGGTGQGATLWFRIPSPLPSENGEDGS